MCACAATVSELALTTYLLQIMEWICTYNTTTNITDILKPIERRVDRFLTIFIILKSLKSTKFGNWGENWKKAFCGWFGKRLCRWSKKHPRGVCALWRLKSSLLSTGNQLRLVGFERTRYNERHVFYRVLILGWVNNHGYILTILETIPGCFSSDINEEVFWLRLSFINYVCAR